MVYKHKYFFLDTESRKVYDENLKKLHITGNAYRLLAFLCKQGNATLTDINDHLDFAKEYTENHIRQYRYKINSVISQRVVGYENGVYSLKGQVEETDELPEEPERNTDFLHHPVSKWQQMKNSVQFTKWPAFISIAVLALSFLDWPYGYFVFLRWVVAGTAAYYAYFLYTQEKMQTWPFWAFVGIAVLFNPIAPIYLYDRAAWAFIDIAVAGVLGIFIYKHKNAHEIEK